MPAILVMMMRRRIISTVIITFNIYGMFNYIFWFGIPSFVIYSYFQSLVGNVSEFQRHRSSFSNLALYGDLQPNLSINWFPVKYQLPLRSRSIFINGTYSLNTLRVLYFSHSIPFISKSCCVISISLTLATILFPAMEFCCAGEMFIDVFQATEISK